ncbi:MAG: hypothetical protein FGM43_04400 [Sinobacteraceae bacterium]|nr:hypothetical protein [Nevskiaceae bacterium]
MTRRNSIIALLLALCALALDAAPAPRSPVQAAVGEGYAEALDRGWLEAVITVRRAEPVLQLAEQVAGWQIVAVPSANGSAASARTGSGEPREWRVGDASGQPGVLRVIEARPANSGSSARPLRASAQPWDTGGHFSVMTRSNDAEGRWRAAEALGWGAWNAPVELDFGGVRLANVILRGPEGVNLSIYERREPRLPDAPDLRGLRRPFNAMQIVRDPLAARRFYVDILKFEVLAEGRYRGAPGVVNNFGMPANLAGDVALDYMILAPVKNGPTQIEVVRFNGIQGRALPTDPAPTLGITALRFPVSRLALIEERLRAANWPLLQAPAERQLPPYGRVRWLAVSSPEGAVLEFFELSDP